MKYLECRMRKPLRACDALYFAVISSQFAPKNWGVLWLRNVNIKEVMCRIPRKSHWAEEFINGRKISNIHITNHYRKCVSIDIKDRLSELTLRQQGITVWWTMHGGTLAGQCGQVGKTLLNIDGIVYRVDQVTARRRLSMDIDADAIESLKPSSQSCEKL